MAHRGSFSFRPSEDSFRDNIDALVATCRKRGFQGGIGVYVKDCQGTPTWRYGVRVCIMGYSDSDQHLRLSEDDGEHRFELERVLEVTAWMGWE